MCNIPTSEQPQISGWLKKLPSNKKTGWRKRFFTLTLSEGFFRYFKSERDAAQGRCLGMVDLRSLLSPASITSYVVNPCSFEIQTQTRLWIFRAANEEERQFWLSNINRASIVIIDRTLTEPTNARTLQNKDISVALIRSLFCLPSAHNLTLLEESTNRTITADPMTGLFADLIPGFCYYFFGGGNMYIDYGSLTDINSIGKGAQGVVFRAYWKSLAVAMKQITSTMIDEENIEFFSELSSLCALRHPNIIQLLGWTQSPTALDPSLAPPKFIITELVEGGDLGTLIDDIESNNSCLLEWPLLLRILSDIAKGGEYLHSKKIIHRDLKPANILIISRLCILIIFGSHIANRFDIRSFGLKLSSQRLPN